MDGQPGSRCFGPRFKSRLSQYKSLTTQWQAWEEGCNCKIPPVLLKGGVLQFQPLVLSCLSLLCERIWLMAWVLSPGLKRCNLAPEGVQGYRPGLAAFFFVSIHPLHILKHPLSLTSHCITHNLHHSPEREGERELAKNWEFFEKNL